MSSKTLNNLQVSVRALSGKSTARRLVETESSVETLETDLTNETSARIQGDQALDARVSALENQIDDLEPDYAVITDAAGDLASSIVTAGELEYVSGATANLQWQINNIEDYIEPLLALPASKAVITDITGEVAGSIVTSSELEKLSGVNGNVQDQIDSKVSKSGDTMTGDLTISRTGSDIPTLSLLKADGSDARIELGTTTYYIRRRSTYNFEFSTHPNSASVYRWSFGGEERMKLDRPGNLSISGTYSGNALSVATLNVTGGTANRAVITDGSKNLASSSTTATEIGYVSGVTAPIQGQLDAKVSKSGDTMTGSLSVNGDLKASSLTIDNADPILLLKNSSNALGKVQLGTADYGIKRNGAATQVHTDASLGVITFNKGTTEWMRVHSNGNVGIGTNSPSAALEVNGNIKSSSLTSGRVLTSSGTTINSSSVTSAELGNLSGSTSNIQGQLDDLGTNKQDRVDGVSDTEIGYLGGVSSDIQTQLDSKPTMFSSTVQTQGTHMVYGCTVGRGTGSATTITFPFGAAFTSSTSYSVQGTARETSGAWAVVVHVFNKTSTSFDFLTVNNSGNRTANDIDWVAVGV